MTAPFYRNQSTPAQVQTAPFYKNYQSSAPVYQQGPQIPQAPSSHIPTSSGSSVSGQDWLSIIQGIGNGAAQGMNRAPQGSGGASKKRHMAQILSQALKRELDLYRMQQGQAHDSADYGANAMQQAARGFTNSLQ